MFVAQQQVIRHARDACPRVCCPKMPVCLLVFVEPSSLLVRQHNHAREYAEGQARLVRRSSYRSTRRHASRAMPALSIEGARRWLVCLAAAHAEGTMPARDDAIVYPNGIFARRRLLRQDGALEYAHARGTSTDEERAMPRAHATYTRERRQGAACRAFTRRHAASFARRPRRCAGYAMAWRTTQERLKHRAVIWSSFHIMLVY